MTYRSPWANVPVQDAEYYRASQFQPVFSRRDADLVAPHAGARIETMRLSSGLLAPTYRRIEKAKGHETFSV